MKSRVQQSWLSVTPVFEALLIEECFGGFTLQHGKRGMGARLGADGVGDGYRQRRVGVGPASER